jgi:hypothetical protein
VEDIAVLAAVRQAPGQRRRALAPLARGGMTPRTSLVVEPLSGRDRCGVGPEWIAGRVGLLRRYRDGERRNRTSKKREWTHVHGQGFYHNFNSQLPTPNSQTFPRSGVDLGSWKLGVGRYLEGNA